MTEGRRGPALEVLPDAAAVALRASALVAEEARRAVAERGRFCLAVSGGSTPWAMLRELGGRDLPWDAVQLFQVDERVAPRGHPDRNLSHLQAALAEGGGGSSPLPEAQVHAMPVEAEELEPAAASYAESLRLLAGEPPVLDLVHLGLGEDGHTASLVPGDPVLAVEDRDVAITSIYQGRRRMTLTRPALDRARRILWLVAGAGKASMLPRLLTGDSEIPAGLVSSERAVVIADAAAHPTRGSTA